MGASIQSLTWFSSPIGIGGPMAPRIMFISEPIRPGRASSSTCWDRSQRSKWMKRLAVPLQAAASQRRHVWW